MLPVDMNSVKERLKDEGYKLTNQRKAMLEVLYENKSHFLSAEEIYRKSREKYPNTNLSTIYRNLDMLEKIGILHRVNINNEASSYELICNNHHHHHIICKDCGKTEIIDYCPVDIIRAKARSKGFVLTDHKFELYGYCKKCHDRQ
jgi:Fe2+ or Zn2+ uptake regulation protein